MPKVDTVTFDSKLDAVGLYRLYPMITVISWKWLWFNPLQVPRGVAPAVWRNTFVDLFCGVFTIMDVGYSILLQSIDHLYRVFGVYDGSGRFPTIRQLRSLLMHWRKRTDFARQKEAFGSLLNRLDGLLTVWPKGLDCSAGYCVPQLITGHTILAINGLADHHRGFLVELNCMWAYTYSEANNLRGEVLRVLFVIDEAEVILGKDVRTALKRTPLFFTQLPRFREFGLGMLVANQSPRGLDERSVMTLARTKIVKNLVDFRDIDCIGSSLGWNAEQRDFCRAMQVNEAAVTIGERMPKSVLINVPYSAVDKSVDWAEVRRLMEPRLRKKFVVQPEIPFPEDKKSPDSTRISEADMADIKRCVVDVVNRPHILKSERLVDLFGPSVSKGQRIAKLCVLENYLKEYGVHVGGRSGMTVLWRLRIKGYDLAGLPRQPLPGIGDVKHQYLQYRVSQKLRGWGFSPQIEMARCGKHVDVGIDRGNKLVAFEIATSARNEVSNVRKDVDAGFDRVVVLPENERVMNAVRRKFARELEPCYAKHVRVISVPDFLSATTLPG